MSLPTIQVVSLLSDISSPWIRAVVTELGAHTGLRLDLDERAPWTERARMLDTGEADVAFMCGLLGARKTGGPAKLEALATPVFAAARYRGEPIYFSDVIVRANSAVQRFAELEGARWAYNDPTSYSGHALVRFHLARLGRTDGFFGRAIESGDHLTSLRMVLEDTVDAAAIDSTVLDLARQQRPDLDAALRVIEVLGPSRAPPVWASRRLPLEVRERLREALVQADRRPEGARALALGSVARFVPATNADYDELLRRATLAEAARLTFLAPGDRL